ncbi:MAG: hypothetical protein N3G22_04595 [Candidatus Micrarchaeota archaeon]|nr:hypothetical protein [Candidatus Micrarchaeota archaeon]
MAEELTYKRLRDLSREEKAQPWLIRLPPDFYSSLEEFLASKFSEAESTKSIVKMREFENALATIKEIIAMRQQKILFKAIRNGGVHSELPEMTNEEHRLYDRFCTLLADEQAQLNSILSRFEGKREMPQGKPEKPLGEDSFKKVRFIKEVPAYRGANEETFGPFKAGETATLPLSEAEWLLKGKLAEIAD